MQTTNQIQAPRIAIRPGFQWDRQDAYLFDIDGTLLRSRDRTHMDSIAAGVRSISGLEITLEGVSVHGNTDTGILREACLRSGVPAEVLEPQIAAILAAMTAHVADNRDQLNLYLMPGVQATLAHLARRGALLGVATGNLEAIAWIKLEVAGLREWFRFGGFSDRYPVRSEMVAHGARKARELAGPNATVCVVGDTPRDIEAAHANNLPVIAVATGNFGFDDLLPHAPEVCASSLADLLASTEAAQ
jgi:phosphoglycolate phosphatase